MSQQMVTTIEDDIDGGEASETVEFGLDGVTYVIDLNDENAKKLRAAFQPFVAKARRTSGRKGQATIVRDFEPKAVRRWADANGIEVSERGRIAMIVVEQFRAAGNGG
jgi:Lsr2